MNGRIYAVHTIMEAGSDFTQVRYYVIDSATNALLSVGEIGDGAHDFYQGSLAVNSNGDVVIGYNRSGSGADGKVSIFAQRFTTSALGSLSALGSAILIKESLTDDYHNGSLKGAAAAGRQRWGDYSSVSLDPVDSSLFWVIGEFAREYNTPEDGHPGGTGGSRWGTYIAAINFAGTNAGVPEPATWAQLILGFALLGGMARRRTTTKVTFA